jgi:hypothetical protein
MSDPPLDTSIARRRPELLARERDNPNWAADIPLF